MLIGERPGLATAESMSAYIAYNAYVGMPVKTNVLSARIIPNGDPALLRQLKVPEGHRSLGIFTTDCDDVSYAPWTRPQSGRWCRWSMPGACTPAAWDFVREHGLQVQVRPPQPRQMTVTPIPDQNGTARYRIVATGEQPDEKPEQMTHLRGNLLVSKTHPQIEFRGKLDTLMAQIILVQRLAHEQGAERVRDELGELLEHTPGILAAEVKQQALPPTKILGMDSEQLRTASRHVKETFGVAHPAPHYEMGRICVALNWLRTQVREVELAAARAFTRDGSRPGRTLSSA